jgi:curved DNA-binding protein CbpA
MRGKVMFYRSIFSSIPGRNGILAPRMLRYCSKRESSFSTSLQRYLLVNSPLMVSKLAVVSVSNNNRLYSSFNGNDPYKLLQIDRNATAKEIKIAYFRQAKLYHPDVNPSGKEKFQQIAEAYELLNDPIKRKEYDTFGTRHSSNRHYDPREYAQHAEDVFKNVSEDVNVVKEAFTDYIDDLKDEMVYAGQCASRGEWSEVWEVVKANSGIVIGLVLPIVLFLRFPALIAVVFRFGILAAQTVFAGLLRSGNVSNASKWLWQRIIHLSKERKFRRRK